MATAQTPVAKADEKADQIATEHADAIIAADTARAGHLADYEDHEVGILGSFTKYKWACIWCIYALWTVVLVGFDMQASNAVVGIPKFRQDFGHAFGDDYVLPAAWQSAFNAAPIAIGIVATLASAELADYVGRKKIVLGALVINFAGVAVMFVATTNPVFFVGKLLNGIVGGALVTVMIGYISEISPLALRGIFTCGVGVSFGLGPLTAFIIIAYTGDSDTRWAYGAVFCSQWFFAVVASLFVYWMPESPWWLSSKGRQERALAALTGLGYTGEHGRMKLAQIQTTLEEMKKETEGSTYMECFRKSNLRRTLLTIMPFWIHTFTGISFVAGYFTYYLQLAGYSTQMSFRLQIAQPVLSIVGNLMAAAIIEKVGRRDLTFWGLFVLTIFLMITGGLGTGTSQPMVQGAVAFILIFSWWFNVSIGSSVFSLISEISTPRLRVKTIAIASASQSLINVMWQWVIPYMFNPDRANMGAKIAFVFGGLCFVSLIYLWFCQPETGGRSYQELDEMFTKKVPARKFKKYQTEVQMQNRAAAAVEEKL